MGEATSESVIIPISPMALGFSIVPGTAPVQNPFAIVLGCADARVPAEMIFDQSLNQLFTIRIAGNVLGIDCLGSIEYAVHNLATHRVEAMPEDETAFQPAPRTTEDFRALSRSLAYSVRNRGILAPLGDPNLA